MDGDTPEDGRFSYQLPLHSPGATRRRFLAAIAGLAGLTLSETVAKRRQRRRKRRGAATTGLGTESQRQAVAIRMVRLRGESGTLSATFTASGAIDDAGPFTVKGVHVGGIGAPTFGVVQTVNRLEGSQGTFTIKETHKFTVTDDEGVFAVNGTWVVLSGTGDYARLHGQGTTSGVIDESVDPDLFDFTLTGTVHFD
jgi:hypothetical protein